MDVALVQPGAHQREGETEGCVDAKKTLFSRALPASTVKFERDEQSHRAIPFQDIEAALIVRSVDSIVH